MKNVISHIFKIVLLSSIFLSIIPAVNAYETVMLNFPLNKGWHKVYYKPGKSENIVQYVPSGQTKDNFKETVVYHSYKVKSDTYQNALLYLKKQLAPLQTYAKGLKVTHVKNDRGDAIIIFCAEDINNKGGQCEVMRSTKSHEGVIVIHYVNRNIKEFWEKKDEWLDRIKKAKTYYSYYRTDYVMNKETYFEL